MEGIENILNGLKKLESMDGKVIGEDTEFIEARLAKDNKQAWVNQLVKQNLKHEPLDVPPEEYMITKRDFVK